MRGLRANSIAAIVTLLVEYGLGMWVNLFVRLPASDHGANVVSGFGRALADGPVGLSVHAALAVILVVSAIAALIRSILVRRAVLITLASASLVAVLAAGQGGARFVGHGSSTASFSMAAATGVAFGAYALVLFLSPLAPLPSQSRGVDPGPTGGWREQHRPEALTEPHSFGEHRSGV